MGDQLIVGEVEGSKGSIARLCGILSEEAIRAVIPILSAEKDAKNDMRRTTRIIAADLDLADGVADGKISRTAIVSRIASANPYFYKLLSAVYKDDASSYDVKAFTEFLANHALQYARHYPYDATCPPPTPPVAPADRPADSQALG